LPRLRGYHSPMLMVLDSLIPVLAVIATGFAARASGLVPEADWRGVERVTYYILIPAILIYTLSMSDLRQVPVGRVALTLLSPVLVMAALILALRGPLAAAGVPGPAFTSVFQGSIRWNSFVALGLAGALHGKEGLAYCAIAFAVLIPFANFASLIVLGRYGSRPEPFRTLPFLATLIRNPFIWSTLIGLALQITGLPLPKMAVIYVDMLGKAALACGLLMVGAGLDLKALQSPGPGLAVAIGLKLLAMPVMTGLLGQWIGLTGPALAVPMICAAVPTAAASYILAKQHGGDAPLMAAIITGQTVLAALTLPVMLLLFAG
jgi:malonate transporter and related proteins